MTAQKWSQEQLQEPVCKRTITLLRQGLGGASPHDIILQFPIRVRPTVQKVLELAAKTKLFATEGKFPFTSKTQYEQCRAIAFGRQSSPDICADAHETMGPQRMSCGFSLPFWSNPYSTDVTAFLLVGRFGPKCTMVD